uniref:protein-serine/threonine phosphatase n=1 Tax=Albugo laibachii Nc14 TaxID=890382 RepID=F0WAG3_9STRA|nr:putative PKGIb [Albugo laibachii Nc14]|eukprot:CCA18134.1 putative PKGIb [Albugo laibachii Nc14]
MGNCCSTEATTSTSNPVNSSNELTAPLPLSLKGSSSTNTSQTNQDHDVMHKRSPYLNDSSTTSSQSSIHTNVSRSPQKGATQFLASTGNDAPSRTQSVSIGNYSIRYAFYSKRGFYPESRRKPNQDSYYCQTRFDNDASKAFFAVYDGHGQFGDVCSQFAAEQLPRHVEKCMSEKTSIQSALTQAHIHTNIEMHEASFDDSMSGTTSISVLFRGNEIHVANVGDSRAIIAKDDTKDTLNLVAKPLSIDQTPFRKDERERVKKCGARILTVDQVEGLEPIHENWGLKLGEEIDENGDPPRIWHPYGQYPGTAFTRSIGDSVSEDLGVTAEPEILSKTLNIHDRFIVIASDGVFEFLTSQNVVDLVKHFDDPSDACQALVEEAYNRWLQYEVRTDDITAICIYLDGVTDDRDSQRGSIYAGAEVLSMQSMLRPVRGALGTDHRRRDTIVGTDAIRLSLTDTMLSDVTEENHTTSTSDGPCLTPIPDGEMQWFKDAVRENFLFNHLPDEKVMEIAGLLTRIKVKKGEIVIRQGTPGNTFYIVESGNLEVRVLSSTDDVPDDDEMPHDRFGDCVHSYNATTRFHPTFGELALIYSKPRAATVIALTDGILWGLDRHAFRSVLIQGRPLCDVVHRLRQIRLLRPLTIAQTSLIAEELKPVRFSAGEVILHEGMLENGFYLITSGKVECRFRINDQAAMVLKSFDYFGEVSLVKKRSISQRTVTAVDATECLFIDKNALEQAVGKLSTILEKDRARRNRKEYYKMARKNATPDSLLGFGDLPENTPKIPFSTQNLEIAGQVLSENTNLVRLVTIKETVPPVYMTLRTASKQAVFDASMHKHICGERDIYIALHEHNVLVPSVIATNTSETDIHLLYDTQLVGTLESFLNNEPHNEPFVRYYSAQALLALEFLHSEGIVSRTLDPSNLLVDRNGQMRMLNLRLSKYVGRGRTYTVCGTPEYLSPEQIKGEGHNIAADYWALGVFIYELYCGKTPFQKEEKDDLTVLNVIASYDPTTLEWEGHPSKELRDLVAQLLNPDFSARLGFRHKDQRQNVQASCDEIKEHPFFAGTSWEATKAGSFSAPLEGAAAARFNEIITSRVDSTHKELNIGPSYTGESAWLSRF